MPPPRFRLRSLLIAVAVASLYLAAVRIAPVVWKWLIILTAPPLVWTWAVAEFERDRGNALTLRRAIIEYAKANVCCTLAVYAILLVAPILALLY